MSFHNITLMLTGMLTGLMAGLFFFWSITIMPGMEKLNDLQYVEAMQNFNREILHPAFFIVFLGSIILLPIVTYLEYKQGLSHKFTFLLVATLIYFAGVVLVTFFGNVPLNNLLDVFDLKNSTPDDYRLMRDTFENPWNRLNWIRTFCSFVSLVLVMLAVVKK